MRHSTATTGYKGGVAASGGAPTRGREGSTRPSLRRRVCRGGLVTRATASREVSSPGRGPSRLTRVGLPTTRSLGRGSRRRVRGRALGATGARAAHGRGDRVS